MHGVVRFQPAARWRLIDEYGAESFTREADGTLLFRRGFPDRTELIRWTLSFLDQAEVLEPAEVRAEICRLAEILREKYDK